MKTLFIYIICTFFSLISYAKTGLINDSVLIPEPIVKDSVAFINDTNTIQIDPNIVIIPDAKFFKYLLANDSINLNKDSTITLDEAKRVKFLSATVLGIKNLKGIEAFTSLTYLDCSGNQITELDITNLTELKWLNCSFNNLYSINLNNNKILFDLNCEYNLLSTLDLSNNNNLSALRCAHNQLTELNISKNPYLITLDCDRNKLTEIDLSNNNLKEIPSNIGVS